MRARQGETICLGEWIRPASADFPPAGGVWGGIRAGFGLGVFGNSAAHLIYPNIDIHSIANSLLIKCTGDDYSDRG